LSKPPPNWPASHRHDANSFGLIGADLVTLNAMLRIPVDMCNVPKDQVFRPTFWSRKAKDDFRACEKLGPLYGK
jgi:L-fucose/D-arabinose isomerase